MSDLLALKYKVETLKSRHPDNWRTMGAVMPAGQVSDMLERIAELQAVCNEAADYLDYNMRTSIGSGSVLHQKLREAGGQEP